MVDDSRETSAEVPVRAARGLAGLVQGVGLFFRATGFLLRHPRNLLLVALPLVLNIILFVVLVYWGFSMFAGSLDAWLQVHREWYWGAMSAVMKTLFWPIVLVVIYFIFTPVALLIAAPFNDSLAERVERACGFGLPEASGGAMGRVVGEVLFVILSEAKRLAFCGGVFVLLFCLNVIPVYGNVAYLVASTYWAVRCISYEFISYAADRRRLTWEEKWGLLRRNWALSVGFGGLAMLLFLIPFVNVLVVPVCAVGGTLLFGMMREGSAK